MEKTLEILKTFKSDILDYVDFDIKRYLTFRVNTIKSSKEEVIHTLNELNIEYENPSWSDLAFIIKNKDINFIKELDIYKDGKIYLQSLSSQLPPIILGPSEDTDILDMASAPGGKTCQIACLTNNKSRILAVEENKFRAEKLKYNLNMQNAIAQVMVMDGRKLDDFFKFDYILLDAPCSGTGCILKSDEKSYKSISKKLIENSSKLQLELLLKALKMLKKGQIMVYSTCSILPIENDDVILKAKSKVNFEVLDISIDLPTIPNKVKGSICVKPTEYYEGFYVCKIKKL